jgi:hypothetical protein
MAKIKTCKFRGVRHVHPYAAATRSAAQRSAWPVYEAVKKELTAGECLPDNPHLNQTAAPHHLPPGRGFFMAGQPAGMA